MPAQIASRTSKMLALLALVLVTACGEAPLPLAPRAQADELIGVDLHRGRRLIAEYGCVACHAVEGVRGPISKVGPPLKDMALRAYIAGVLPNTTENLVRWLLDPPAIDPLTAMPAMGLSVGDTKDIAAYLLAPN